MSRRKNRHINTRYFLELENHMWCNKTRKWIHNHDDGTPRNEHSISHSRKFRTMRAAERGIRAILVEFKDVHRHIILDRIGHNSARSWSIVKGKDGRDY